MILDLESPAKASRRSKSLRDAGATIMQDTNAFQEEEQPESPKASKSQYPMRSQVEPVMHTFLLCLCRSSATPLARLHCIRVPFPLRQSYSSWQSPAS